MPGIIVGERKEPVEGGPGQLSQESLARARNILEEKIKQREKEKSPPPGFGSKPETSPPGYLDPTWNAAEGRWVCCSQMGDLYQIWDQEKGVWLELKDFEKG